MIELMVAIAIVAILAAIAWPSYTQWQERDGLKEGVMFLKSAMSAARSHSIQSGLACGCPPGVACTASHVPGGCTSRVYGIRLDTANNRIRLMRFCDSDGEMCTGSTATSATDAGELSQVWSRDLHRYVSFDTASTTSNLVNNGLFFNKAGQVSGSSGSIFLTAGGNRRCLVVSSTGRIREGVPNGSNCN